MTDKSLSERLREFSVVVYNSDGSQGRIYPPICTEAADDRDAKDALLAQIVERCAKVADEWLAMFEKYKPEYIEAQTWANDAVKDIAAAIRKVKP